VTGRQAQVYAFIRDRVSDSGVPPTMEEIAAELGIASRGSAHSYVRALVTSGHLEARQVYGAPRYFPVEQAAA
jgi:repressor LexA